MIVSNLEGKSKRRKPDTLGGIKFSPPQSTGLQINVVGAYKANEENAISMYFLA